MRSGKERRRSRSISGSKVNTIYVDILFHRIIKNIYILFISVTLNKISIILYVVFILHRKSTI